MTTIDLYTDASVVRAVGGVRASGAYVIGAGGTPVQVRLHGVGTSVAAECLTMAIAIHRTVQDHALARGVARNMLRDYFRHEVQLVGHIDIDCILGLMERGKLKVARLLRSFVKAYAIRMMPDAAKYKEYGECHRHARIQNGLLGVRHPLYVKLQPSGYPPLPYGTTLQVEDDHKRLAPESVSAMVSAYADAAECASDNGALIA